MKNKKIWWGIYIVFLLLISAGVSAYTSLKESVIPVDKNRMTYDKGSLYGIEDTGKNTYTFYKSDLQGKIYEHLEWTFSCQSGDLLEVAYLDGYDDKDLYTVKEIDSHAAVSGYQIYEWDHVNASMKPFLEMKQFIGDNQIPVGICADGTVIAYEYRKALGSAVSEFSFSHIDEDGEPVVDGTMEAGVYSLRENGFFGDYGWIIIDGYGNCIQLHDGQIRTIFENDGSRFGTHNVMISLNDDCVVMHNPDDKIDISIPYDAPENISTYPCGNTVDIGGKSYEDSSLSKAKRSSDGSILYGFVEVDENNTIFYASEQEDGNEQGNATVISKVSYPSNYIIKKFVPRLIINIVLGLLAAYVIGIWIYVYHMRLSLYLKILLIMIISVAVITNLVYRQNYKRISAEIVDNTTQNQYRDARYYIGQINIDVLQQIVDSDKLLSEEIRGQLFRGTSVKWTSELYNMNSQSEETFTTHRRYIPEFFVCRGDDIYYLTYDGIANVECKYEKSKKVADAIEKSITENTLVTLVYQNGTQYVRGLVMPIQKSDGTVLGAIKVMEPEEGIEDDIQSEISDLRYYQNLWYGVLLLILMVALYFFLRPIKKLTVMADKLGRGELDARMRVKGHDEIAEISSVFNRMADGITQNLDELKRYTDAYAKFIPKETFQAMGKENITELSLMCEADMPAVILVTATNLYEEMIPYLSTQNLYVFDFINDALRVQLPAISRHGGGTGTFEEGGTTAYFINKPEEALKAAIDAVDALNKSELYFGTKEAKFQAAIGFGMMHVGVVGIADRMQIQNVSNEESLVKFLRRIAENHGAEILVLEEAAKQIPDFRSEYRVRTFGYVRLSANDSLRLVYEVFDTNYAKERIAKEQTLEEYEKGVKLFIEGKAAEARNSFVNVLRVNKFDKAAQRYFYLCDKYMNEEKTDYERWVEEY